MAPSPAEITLELVPENRFSVIDVNKQVVARGGDHLLSYPKALYCSFHTTAGYFDQRLWDSFEHCSQSMRAYVQSYRNLFPAGADYRHDQMDLRMELSEEQRKCEPRNADSHLTFIGAGLENCVTYTNRPNQPVFFIDLDGVNGKDRRRRRTTIMGFNRATVAERTQLVIPVSTHPMDSVNLRDPKLGIIDQLNEAIRKRGITKGRIDLSLAPQERNAGLTVNEFETLLMTHDLVDVLKNPFRFMAEKGKNMLRDPRAIPYKAKNYAKYDLVQVVNEFLDKTGLSESIVERVIDKFLRLPASRALHMKRKASLLISDNETPGQGSVVQGTYQSPILVQWRKTASQARLLNATFVRFE